MSIRKEQVLLLLVVLLGAWAASGYFAEPTRMAFRPPAKEEYTAAEVHAASLAPTTAPPLQRRYFSTEPSETRPLPPRDLSFPPRAPLSLCGLPLDPGPDFAHSWMLEQDGVIVADVQLAQGAAAEAGAGDGGADAAAAAQEAAPGPLTDEQLAKIYDRIWVGGLTTPFYGRLEAPPGVDLFELEESKQFGDVELRMRTFKRTKEKMEGLLVAGGGNQPIDQIQLADTLRNQITREVRKVPELASAQGARHKLILWLLEKARTDSSVHEDVMAQAEIYLQMSGGTLDGLRLMQKVLRAQGDLDRELKMLEGIQGNDREMSFKLEGLGVLKARLGLWIEAEQNLREAARLNPNDARPHGALAEFLRRRGRSEEALDAALRAKRTIGAVQDDDDRGRILRTVVGCQLMVGDLDGARDTLRGVPEEAGRTYLRGCIEYAGGDVSTALGSFRQAAVGLDAGAAQLGQAACLLWNQQWQEAHDLFVRVADQSPLLRHRAATGLALLFCRLGQFDEALGAVERALEASPGDAYALYLRGRALRLMGQFGPAKEALEETLRVRDDFLHAIAEMAAVLGKQASSLPATEQAKSLLDARRYSNRAVTLSPEPELELLERQGLRAFFANQRRAARAAFERARDLATDDRSQGYNKGAIAVVDYSRGRVEDAVIALERLERDFGRDSELGSWANATLQAIEDHAQKEWLGDGFDREQLGDIWANTAAGGQRFTISDGRLSFDGDLSRQGDGELVAERVGAVQKARNFLACAVTLELGPRHDAAESFCGLGIEIRRGNRGVDMSARVGVRDGEPFLAIQDGKQDGVDALEQHKLSVPLRTDGPQELELRVVPRSEDANNRQLSLLVFFNSVLVHTHDLKQLTLGTTTELKTVLFVTGDKGARAQVYFDDYELERRKEGNR